MTRMAVSPLGDEIVYARLHDPPALAPYLVIVLRHLESGREKELAQAPLPGGGLQFTPDGDFLLWGDGVGQTLKTEPWAEETERLAAAPGRQLAISGSGRYLWIDGQLLRDTLPLVDFPKVAGAEFVPGTDWLMVRSAKRTFFYSGLEGASPSSATVPASPKLLRLRKWRSLGIIDQDEFQTYRATLLEQ